MISKNFNLLRKRFSDNIQHKTLSQLLDIKKKQDDEKSYNIKYKTLNNMTTIMSSIFGLMLLRNGYIVTSILVGSITLYRHLNSGTKVEKALRIVEEKFTDKNLKQVTYVLE